jgi:hypothetical protein
MLLIAVVTQSELEALLETLPTSQHVNLGFGDPEHPGWFRAEVVAHDVSNGRLTLTCFMDRVTDRPLEPGERVVIAARRLDNELQSAPMDVERCGSGRQALVELRMAGMWQPEDERRQHLRVPLQLKATRARRWALGAWQDISATVVDLSSRGIGLSLESEVRIGERLSLSISLDDGAPDVRFTVEVRHVHATQHQGTCRAGGAFRNLTPADHERVIRFIFAELRSTHSPLPPGPEKGRGGDS